jgi:hypothetical protein
MGAAELAFGVDDQCYALLQNSKLTQALGSLCSDLGVNIKHEQDALPWIVN